MRLKRLNRMGAWGLGFLLFPAALLGGLYLAWPAIASSVLTRVLSAQGCEHPSVEVARPTVTHLDIPLLTCQRKLGADQTTVTIEQVRVEYTLASLRDRRVERVAIPQASIQLTPTALRTAEAVTTSPASFSDWLRPIPLPPLRELSLGLLAVRREGYDGQVHEGTLSGTLRVEAGRVLVDATVQPQGSPPYGVALNGTSLGEIALQVSTGTATSSPKPVLSLESTITPSDATVSLSGKIRADVHELAPLLALVLPLDGAIQAATGTIDVAWNGSASAQVPPAEALVQPETTITGGYRISGTVPAWADWLSGLTGGSEGTWTWAQRQLTWTLAQGAQWEAQVSTATLNLPVGLLPHQLSRLPVRVSADGVVEGRWDGLAGRVNNADASTPMTMRVTGPLALRIGDRPSGLSLEATSSSIAWRGGNRLDADGTLHLQGTGGPAIRSWFAAQQLTMDLTAAATLTAQHVELRLQPGSSVQLAKMAAAQSGAERASLTVRRPLPWRMALDPKAEPVQTIASGEIDLRAEGVTIAGQAITFDRATASITDLATAPRAWGGWTGGGSLRLIAVRPTVQGMTLAAGDLTVDGKIDAVGARAQLEAATSDGLLALTGTATHQAEKGTGEARLAVKPMRLEPGRALSTLVTPWSAPFDATGGTVEGSGSFAWERAASGPFDLREGTVLVQLHDVAGRMRQMTFSGLTTAAQVQLRDGLLQMPEPATITMASARAGIDITRLSAQVQAGWERPGGGPTSGGTGGDPTGNKAVSWAPTWIDAKQLRAAVFGGTVSSDGMRYRPGQAPHSLTLQLQGLQLQEVLNLEQQKGLDGTGVLDGTIPLTLSTGGLSVEQGTVAARQPGGVIRYRPAEDSAAARAASQAALGMVLQPLADFHYNVLTATARLMENGTLTLATRLEGKNPAWQAGRPVHFNLTVEENIPALLKTLGLVGELQESIGKRFEPRGGRSQ